MFAISIYVGALLNGEILLLSANLLPFMLRILNYGYTNHRQQKTWMGNFVLYLFFHKLNFPFRKTRNFFGDFKSLARTFLVFFVVSSHFSSRFFIYIIQTKLSFFPPFIPSMMIKSIHKRAEREVSSRVEKQFKETQPESNIYWRHYPDKSASNFSIFQHFPANFKKVSDHFPPSKKTLEMKQQKRNKKKFPNS